MFYDGGWLQYATDHGLPSEAGGFDDLDDLDDLDGKEEEEELEDDVEDG